MIEDISNNVPPTATPTPTIVVPQQQKVIAQLTEELRLTRSGPPQLPPAATLSWFTDEEDFSTLPETQYSLAPWHQPDRVLALIKNLVQHQAIREAAAARLFQAPSATRGFQYLYIPTKVHVPLGKLRTTFKKLEVNNGRFLDLHYADCNIVAVLVHNDYAPELQELLTK
ncbi:uncharacterized protein BX663DRAFT_561725 [Cokeromyces recurvatus]|uniref:uncharacterized protein n=1 Tax=Cokeromyces recurvatus TaxID=90255 RepID=UPI00221FCF68|nr:uncharacterized protein BX663DRAFT_561725 [Cokeromyces recurvatus]KAI7902147.1 hypothetical protein BX663DRAFT_561725 [Cokeromyces recurvatus]